MARTVRPKVCRSDVLRLRAEGLTLRAIAAALGISKATVTRKLEQAK